MPIYGGNYGYLEKSAFKSYFTDFSGLFKKGLEAFQEAKVLSGFEQDEKVPLIRWEPPIVSILQCFAGAENFRYCFMRGDLTQEAILASRWEEMSHVEARKIHRFLSAAKKTEPQALWLDHFGLKIR